MVQALPQYTEQMQKLSLHVEIAGKINKMIRDTSLRDLGQLEQDIVFDDAATKEVITFLRAHPDASVENKLRFLMIYASVHPDKFEGDKATKIMQLAKLSAEDMRAIKNMRLLAGSPNAKKKAVLSFSLTFDGKRKKIFVRKDKTNAEEESWALSKFCPMIESWDATSISLTTACDMFMRYVTRASALEYEDFNSARFHLMERAEKFGEITYKVSNMLPVLKCGIGVHHSGLLPILKEVIEILSRRSH